MIRSLFITSLSCIALFEGSEAAIVASANFDDTIKSGTSQTMTGVDWTTDFAALVTTNTSITTVANANNGYFTTGFGATGFAPDQNIENEGPWTATIEITLNSATGSLSSISFDYAGLTNTGSSQGGNFRAQNFDINVNGSVYDAQKQTTAVNGSITFTDTATLSDGLNTITITSSEVNGPGYNMGIDNLVFNGTVSAIPEPSCLSFIGLTGLLLLRRRR